MRILGIDPGIGTTGWSILVPDPTCPKLVASGIITTVSSVEHGQRLVVLQQEISRLIVFYQPTTVAIEKLFFAKNITTAMKVSEARGVILMTVARHRLAVHEYSPPQIKQSITGYGNASKRQVIDMLRHHLPSSTLPTQDDAADAVAVALTHLSVTTSSITNHQPASPAGRSSITTVVR